MFVNITEKPPWGSVIKTITIITITITQELLCQFRSVIMKLEDDVRISGGTRTVASGDNQSRAQDVKDQMTQLTQENVTTSTI